MGKFEQFVVGGKIKSSNSWWLDSCKPGDI